MCCFRIGTWAKKNSSNAHKTESRYLKGILFKISDEHPRPFYEESHPGEMILRRKSSDLSGECDATKNPQHSAFHKNIVFLAQAEYS